jgi:hypothetical protein
MGLCTAMEASAHCKSWLNATWPATPAPSRRLLTHVCSRKCHVFTDQGSTTPQHTLDEDSQLVGEPEMQVRDS